MESIKPSRTTTEEKALNLDNANGTLSKWLTNLPPNRIICAGRLRLLKINGRILSSPLKGKARVRLIG